MDREQHTNLFRAANQPRNLNQGPITKEELQTNTFSQRMSMHIQQLDSTNCLNKLAERLPSKFVFPLSKTLIHVLFITIPEYTKTLISEDTI